MIELLAIELFLSSAPDSAVNGVGVDDGFDMHASSYASTHGRAILPGKSAPSTPTYSTSELACELSMPGALVCQDPEAAQATFCNSVATSAPYEVSTYRREDNEQLSSEILQLPCNPETPEPAARVQEISVSQRDFQSLNLTASTITVMPNDGDLYVNLPIFMNTTAEPQTLTTQLLATPVTIRATPKDFTWNYGDTTTKTGTTPGSTYPDKTYAHTYTTPGTYTITLTTTWSGQYSTNNGETWTDIDGTATTTSTTNPLTVQESIPILTK